MDLPGLVATKSRNGLPTCSQGCVKGMTIRLKDDILLQQSLGCAFVVQEFNRNRLPLTRLCPSKAMQRNTFASTVTSSSARTPHETEDASSTKMHLETQNLLESLLLFKDIQHYLGPLPDNNNNMYSEVRDLFVLGLGNDQT